MPKLIWRFVSADDDGATIVEYALMATLIAMTCVAAVGLLGTGVNGLFAGVQIP